MKGIKIIFNTFDWQPKWVNKANALLCDIHCIVALKDAPHENTQRNMCAHNARPWKRGV